MFLYKAKNMKNKFSPLNNICLSSLFSLEILKNKYQKISFTNLLKYAAMLIPTLSRKQVKSWEGVICNACPTDLASIEGCVPLNEDGITVIRDRSLTATNKRGEMRKSLIENVYRVCMCARV